MTKRTCQICHKNINLTDKYDGSYVKINTSFYHCSCWVSHKTNLKRGAWTQQRCDDYLKPFKKSTYQEVKSLYYEKKVNEWISSFYNITYLSTKVNTYLRHIYNGTYKNLMKPVPPADLYDMLVRQESSLKEINKQFMQRKSCVGEIASQESLLYYDLAIILSKYDNYLEWKAQSKQEIIQRKKILDSHIDYEKIFLQESKGRDNSLEINDILNEI